MALEGLIDANLPVAAFFTSRSGGVSLPPYAELNLADHVRDEPDAVEKNRGIVSAHAGAPVSFLNAAHGIAVARITTADHGRLPSADILVTTVPGVALGAIAADCAAVLLHDGETGAVAAVHCGREGLYEGVIDTAVSALTELQDKPADGASLMASIGPSICGRCYEVPQHMQERVVARHPDARSLTRAGTPALDIARAIESRLHALGLVTVTRSRICTFENANYFSHRRDGVTGRHAGVVVCEGAKVPFVQPDI